jgi:hypothetical protein
MRTVAIYGNSLVLSSIRASLEHRTELRVLSFDAAMPAVALWKAQPHVLLIGVDLAADRALVLSGQSSHVLTPDDLVQVIETRAPLGTKA